MQAETLIKKLQALVAQYGNLYVENEDGEGVSVEYNDDTTPAFVIY